MEFDIILQQDVATRNPSDITEIGLRSNQIYMTTVVAGYYRLCDEWAILLQIKRQQLFVAFSYLHIESGNGDATRRRVHIRQILIAA